MQRDIPHPTRHLKQHPCQVSYCVMTSGHISRLLKVLTGINGRFSSGLTGPRQQEADFSLPADAPRMGTMTQNKVRSAWSTQSLNEQRYRETGLYLVCSNLMRKGQVVSKHNNPKKAEEGTGSGDGAAKSALPGSSGQ